MIYHITTITSLLHLASQGTQAWASLGWGEGSEWMRPNTLLPGHIP